LIIYFPFDIRRLKFVLPIGFILFLLSDATSDIHFASIHQQLSYNTYLAVTEAELIAGCKAGKRDLQKALYTRFSAKMLGVCLRYTKNRDEAEDLLQEGFIKVFHNIEHFSASGSFEGWIRKIMVNTALESIRRRKIEFSTTDIQQLEDDYEADANVLSRLGHQELLIMIQSLSPGYQLIFNLYAVEGYQHKEIAAMLNISEGTSKSQFARARLILQDKIKNGLIQKLSSEHGRG
jgi:RNA polymerase sigma-70 factor (ECF subfamily)